jgi:hypothetical protein
VRLGGRLQAAPTRHQRFARGCGVGRTGGVGAAAARRQAMGKALARAFRWRKMPGESVYSTIEDLARSKRVHATYVSRVLWLTLLAPEIVEAILDGRSRLTCSWMICLRGFRWSGRGERTHLQRRSGMGQT